MAHKQEHTEDFPQLGDGFELHIRTDGEKGRVTAFASVCEVEKHDGYSSQKHRLFEDYSQPVMRDNVRATQKNIDTIHAEAMAVIDQVRSAAIEHYTKKGYALDGTARKTSEIEAESADA